MTQTLVVGAGRMGGAIITGWRAAGSPFAEKLMIRTPSPRAAMAKFAMLNPPAHLVAQASAVLLAVKPQVWRGAVEQLSEALAPDAVIVSVIAGVGAAEISQAFGGRRVARVMPTTAVSIRQGTASVYAPNSEARAVALSMFSPIATTVLLDDEWLMHAATAVSGSAPAYLYAFVEALEAAGMEQGLTAQDSARLARSTITGAAALLAQGAEEPAELRKQVTSPGGTTAAALSGLMGEGGFGDLLPRALAAAVRRSEELAR